MNKKLRTVLGVTWGIISIFLALNYFVGGTLFDEFRSDFIFGIILTLILVLTTLSAYAFIYADDEPHTHYYRDALTGDEIEKQIPSENNVSKNTKIFITVIFAIFICFGIVAYTGGQHIYHEGYDKGHDAGYEVGYDEGRDEGYDEAGEAEPYEPIAGTDTYLTTDNAPPGTVWITPHGEKYHESGCQYINGRHDLLYYDTAEEAELDGYTPCSECH